MPPADSTITYILRSLSVEKVKFHVRVPEEDDDEPCPLEEPLAISMSSWAAPALDINCRAFGVSPSLDEDVSLFFLAGELCKLGQ